MLGEHHRQADAGITRDPSGQGSLGGCEEELAVSAAPADHPRNHSRGGEDGVEPVKRDLLVGRGEDRPDEPVPGPDEALVEVRAVSINRGEALDIADAAPGSPLGWDLAGVVVRAAESGGPEVGTRVAGVTGERAWATHAAVPIRHLAPIPEGLTAQVAAALPVAGLTAMRLLRRLGDLAGCRVVVTGATGGVGIWPYNSRLLRARRS